jgi:hypothetical protein
VTDQDDFRLDAKDPGGIHPGQCRISPLTKGISWEQWEAERARGQRPRPKPAAYAAPVRQAPGPSVIRFRLRVRIMNRLNTQNRMG